MRFENIRVWVSMLDEFFLITWLEVSREPIAVSPNKTRSLLRSTQDGVLIRQDGGITGNVGGVSHGQGRDKNDEGE